MPYMKHLGKDLLVGFSVSPRSDHGHVEDELDIIALLRTNKNLFPNLFPTIAPQLSYRGE